MYGTGVHATAGSTVFIVYLYYVLRSPISPRYLRFVYSQSDIFFRKL